MQVNKTIRQSYKSIQEVQFSVICSVSQIVNQISALNGMQTSKSTGS